MTTKATRHSKTPAQRAQETVDILTRRQVKIAGQTRVLETQHKALVAELEVVTKRLDYAKASPDLPPTKPPGPQLPPDPPPGVKVA
jgi:hypothetical protein